MARATVVGFVVASVAAVAVPSLIAQSPDLFTLTTVTRVELTFTADQFAALVPSQAAGGGIFTFFGGGAGRGGFDPEQMGGGRGATPGQPPTPEELAAMMARFGGPGRGAPGGAPARMPTAAELEAIVGRLGGAGGVARGGLPAGPQMMMPQMMLQGREGQRNGLASAMGIEFAYVHAGATIGDGRFADIGVRYKGNGTYLEGRASGKASLKLDLNHFVKGQKFGDVKTVNLHNNITDASYMNEPLAFRLYRDAGVPAPRSSYARVYVSVTGQQERRYAGLYSIIENPDEVFLKARGLPEGAIFKPVTPSLFADLGTDWAKYNQTYDPKTDLTEAQKQRVIDTSRFVSSASDADFAAHVGDYFDLDAVARYLAVTVFLSDMDGMLGSGQNYYMHLHPTTNKFSFMAWDQDHSWGQFFLGTDQADILRPWTGQKRFLERLFAAPAFRTPYLARMREFSATLFKPERISAQVDEVADAIRAAVADESADRLERLNRAAAGESVGGAGGFAGLMGRTPIKPFVVARSRVVTAQLAALATVR